jgi:serine/threonine protein kinase
MAPPITTLPLNTLLHDRYQIARLLARGGMGAVYQAADRHNGTTVALKQSLTTDERLRKAFEREARILSRLRHPSLPVVSDSFFDECGQFLVMEYIPGDDLETLLQQKGKAFSTTSALSWVMRWADQLLGSLEYLHSQEHPIIHRDIKPQNLKPTARGDIMLLDFGIAKSVADQTRHSAVHSVRGYTRYYAPLEQIQGTGTDPRSDLYALAATLYHLMTGEPPPDALTRVAALLSGQPDPLQSAHKLNPRVPSSVAFVIHQAMEQKIADRFASAKAMRMALRVAVNQSGTLSTSSGRQSTTDSSGLQTIVAPLAEDASTPPPSSPESLEAPSEAGPSSASLSPSAPLPSSSTASLRSPLVFVVDQQGNGHCQTISEAIGRSRPGTRILVRPGCYHESLVIDRFVEIVGDGEGHEIILESSTASCVQMQTSYALIRGISIHRTAGPKDQLAFAVDIPQGRLVLEECTISSETVACVAIHGSNTCPSLWQCTIRDGKGMGVFVYEQGRGVIEACDIIGHMIAGIKIIQGSTPLIRACQVCQNKQDGIAISGKSAAIVESCTISDNERAGIFIRQMSTPYIRRCLIRDRAQGHGLVVGEKGEGIIEECHISGDASSHVSIAQDSTPLIRRCTIGTLSHAHTHQEEHEHEADPRHDRETEPPEADACLPPAPLRSTNHAHRNLSSRITAHLRRNPHP